MKIFDYAVKHFQSLNMISISIQLDAQVLVQSNLYKKFEA